MLASVSIFFFLCLFIWEQAISHSSSESSSSGSSKMRLYLSLICAACMINSKLNKLLMKTNKTTKVKINALFHRLQINKNIRFQTRILWKRHQNKVETKLVNHQHGYSIMEETLTLEFNLVWNESKSQYEEKNTEIVAVIMYEGKIKSGGYAKYDIAQVVNQGLDGKVVSIPLTQCPDPNANVEVTFTCTMEEEGFSEITSVLNASSRDLSMSRVDFHDDKISLQMGRINETITKLDQLAHSLKTKEKNTLEKVPELVQKVQELEGENSILKRNIKNLEQKLEEREGKERERAKADQKAIKQLQVQLQKKEKTIKSKQIIELDQDKKLQEELTKKDREIQKYKDLLEQAKSELQQTKVHALRKSSVGFKMEIQDEVNNIANFDSEKDDLVQEATALRNQNSTLQSNVAAMSYKLAQLFNAAYQFGGAKLLDYLQTAIGLTQL